MAHAEQSIGKVHDVLAVHDLHVWTVGSGVICCSCQIMVAPEQTARSDEQVLWKVNEELGQHLGIGHTTIQVEVGVGYWTMQTLQCPHGADHNR
jgi:cobalt-zinc-cadmium efflux system protein